MSAPLQSSDDFLLARERAQSRIGELAWNKLSPRDCATAIYQEMRALDGERLSGRMKAAPMKRNS
jgi:hypothetical protein